MGEDFVVILETLWRTEDDWKRIGNHPGESLTEFHHRRGPLLYSYSEAAISINSSEDISSLAIK